MESAWTTTSSFARDDETSDTSSMVFTEIQRQIQSKNQVMLTADATSKTYQIKIKSLEEFIKNLQNELAEKNDLIREKEGIIEALQNGNSPIQTDSKQVKGLTKLNTDLLQQNTELRMERESLRAKLSLFRQSFESDTSEISDTGYKNEIEKILHPKIFSMLPRLQSVKKYEHGTQTDPMDYFDASQEARLTQIELSRDKYKQSYEIEKEINRELQSSLSHIKRDAEKLEEQYNKLSNDAEIALASERLATQTIHEVQTQNQQLKQQITSLEADLEEMTLKYSKMERDYEVLSKTVTAAEAIRVKTQPLIDPVIYLESQWAKDRSKYYTETEQLKKRIDELTSQNQYLESELKIKTMGMPKPAEYAETVAKLSIAEDRVKKLGQECRVAKGSIMSLEATVLKLETTLATRQTQLKNAQFQITLLKNSIEKKDSLIKENTDKVNKYSKTIESLEQKVKMEASNGQSKESLIKDFKTKIEQLETITSKTKQETQLIESLDTTIKTQKQDLLRKQNLVKHWKEKAMKLETVYLTDVGVEINQSNDEPSC